MVVVLVVYCRGEIRREKQPDSNVATRINPLSFLIMILLPLRKNRRPPRDQRSRRFLTGGGKRLLSALCRCWRSAPWIKKAAFLNFSPSGRDKSEGAGGGNSFFPQPANVGSSKYHAKGRVLWRWGAASVCPSCSATGVIRATERSVLLGTKESKSIARRRINK